MFLDNLPANIRVELVCVEVVHLFLDTRDLEPTDPETIHKESILK